MPIDFRNPLANQNALLSRLRGLIGHAGTPADSAMPPDGNKDGRHADRVSLSNDAQRITNGLRGNESRPNNDVERVAAVRQAIESGTYQIDTARIADKVSLQYGSR